MRTKNNTTKTVSDVTEEQFLRYVKVQKRGKFNMLMDSIKAANAASLDDDTYWTIIRHYGELQQLHGDKNK